MIERKKLLLKIKEKFAIKQLTLEVLDKTLEAQSFEKDKLNNQEMLLNRGKLQRQMHQLGESIKVIDSMIKNLEVLSLAPGKEKDV